MEVEVSEYIRYINNNTENGIVIFLRIMKNSNLCTCTVFLRYLKIIPLHTIIQNYMNGSI